MTNPFHALRDFLLEQYPYPWANDVVQLVGKTSRGLFILLVAALLITLREAWVRFWRSDLQGRAFRRNQAYTFAGLVGALHAPCSLSPQLSWMLFAGVLVALLIYFGSLLAIRVLCAPTHRQMIQGDMEAAQDLGWYTLGAALAAHAVVGAVLNAYA